MWMRRHRKRPDRMSYYSYVVFTRKLEKGDELCG